jgi:CDP-diacylglycerol--glycerol-3-phosphate 3-phosphatidyltransferase
MAISVYDLKPRFQALLRPLVRRLAAAGVTANAVTLFACVMSVGVGAWLALGGVAPRGFLVLPVVLLLRMALNAVDGMLAREFGQKSRLGGFLNELTDVVSDAALLWPFAYVEGTSGWLVAVIALLAALSEHTGVVGVMVGASRRYDGPMGKSDRALVLGVLGLVVGLGVDTGSWLGYVLAAMALLTAWTVANRVRGALAEAAAGGGGRG